MRKPKGPSFKDCQIAIYTGQPLPEGVSRFVLLKLRKHFEGSMYESVVGNNTRHRNCIMSGDTVTKSVTHLKRANSSLVTVMVPAEIRDTTDQATIQYIGNQAIIEFH